MAESILQEHTRRMLEDPLLGAQDLDTKVLALLEAEYLRRLARYERADRELSQKYGLTFLEFTTQRMVQQKGYTWDVETDAMDWETAVSGVNTLTAKLQELRASTHGHDR
jgi:hypothetical protein